MKKAIAAVICLVLVLGIAAGVFFYRKEQAHQEYLQAHVFLGEDVYPKDAEVLDLRGKPVTTAYYDQLQALLPDCQILWNVPFQGGEIPSNVTDITISSLTKEDTALLLNYFPYLTGIHAEDCTDYALLSQLQQQRPQWTVSYQVAIAGQKYPLTTTALDLATAEAGELMENLTYLPQLTSLHFSDPQLTAQELTALMEAYPQITFRWEKTVLGASYSSGLTELDLSNIPLETTDTLEQELAYFPHLEKVILSHCGLDSETLAAYRDRVREDYKVVWEVKLGRVWTRTDTDTYMPIREGDHVRDIHLSELKYCEDLIVVDLGHMGVEDTQWIYHTPKLQFLILADTDVSDITPIGTLKELIYLELFKSPDITDYTPLLGCTALQDLNLAFTNGDVNVLAQMTWLQSLWANYCGATEEEKQFLRDSLPNTLLELDSGWHMGNGWRDRPNYYVMRDILKMPYYDWGSKRLAEINKKKYGTG